IANREQTAGRETAQTRNPLVLTHKWGFLFSWTDSVTTIKAIPTMYRGVQFRSRLEAKYACLFDQLGWVWDYEQLDYDGYIPDFTLAFKKPMLVEVKPINDWFGFDWNPVIEKAIDSGVKGRLMVVGAKVFHFESLGATTIGRIYEQELFPDDAYCVPTVVHLCDHCGK